MHEKIELTEGKVIFRQFRRKPVSEFWIMAILDNGNVEIILSFYISN